MADLDKRLGPPEGGEAGADLDTRLTGNLAQNQASLAALQGSETPSSLDLLLRPENLAKLGLAAAGALSGNADLQALAAGLGMGTLEGAGAQAAGIEEDKQVQIDNLIGMVDKQQQRLTTLMTTRPDLLLDEEGGALPGTDPESLAALSGLTQVSPAAWNSRAESTAEKEKIWQVQGKLFEKAYGEGNVAVASQALSHMFGSSGMEVSPEEAADMMAIAPESLPAVLAQRADLSSVVELMVWSEQNNMPWWDESAPKLRPRMEAGSGADAITSTAVQGMSIIAARLHRLQTSADPEDQALAKKYIQQPELQTEILNDKPEFLQAVKKVFPGARMQDEIIVQSRRYLAEAMSNPNAITALMAAMPGLTGEGDHTEEALSSLFQSIYQQMDLQADTISEDVYQRILDGMSTEELQARLDELEGN